MSVSEKISLVRQQKFAPPDRSVSPITSTIAGDSNNLLVQTVFRHTTDHVSVIVLYPDELDIFLSKRIFSGKIFRMQVVSHYFRFDAEQSLIMLNGILVVVVGFHILQITYMMAYKSVVIFGKAEGIF